MTERFSPEYIAFILEAKVLQEGHDISIGEYRILIGRFKDDRPWIVTHGTGLGLTAQGVRSDGSTLGCLYAQERSRWLPTLTDLLDMIEEAGYWWSTGLDYDGDDRWYTVSAGNIEAGDRIENDHEDLMVAAAKLAVRVLEGKGIEKFDWEQDVQRELMDA